MSEVAPTISVVIPAWNAEDTLGEQLEALLNSDEPGVDYEVIVADNGSTDGTAAIATSFGGRVRVIDASRAKGPNVARNCGARAARGDWLLYCDSDDVVDRSWLGVMRREFEAGHDLLAGPIDYMRLNDRVSREWRGADRAGITPLMSFLPGVHGANCGLTKSLFNEMGGFDESLDYGSDEVELFWRAQLADHTLRMADDAIVHYRLRDTLPDLWRQFTAYGTTQVLLYRKFRDVGVQRRTPGAVLRTGIWLATRAPFAIPRGRRGAWIRVLAEQWGRARSSIRYHSLYI